MWVSWDESMANNSCRLQDDQLIMQTKLAVVVDPAILNALHGHEPIRAKWRMARFPLSVAFSISHVGFPALHPL